MENPWTYSSLTCQMHLTGSATMYADDIKIYAAYDTTNKSEVQAAFRLSLAKMSEWAASWGLTINLNKCSLLHLGDNFSPREALASSFMEIRKRFYSLILTPISVVWPGCWTSCHMLRSGKR
ncbi:hypothetical protein COOONC_05381 [Cooperia oncophora]